MDQIHKAHERGKLDNPIKRVKRAAFGFRTFSNYRVRALQYGGKPNWNPLAAVTPH
ncbi:MAG: hypothetical protein OXI84_04965 [bacterium]|nr:hypothetical protein [bacterium]